MTFPNKKKIKGWIFTHEELDGWEDLGEMDWIGDGNGNSIKRSHLICGTVCRIAKEDGKTFRYCPRCLRRVAND